MVHGCFPRWRKSHSGRLPIPESRRRAATELAKDHGVLRTAKVLSLEYGRMLNISARNWNDRFSPIGKNFIIVKSTSLSPLARRLLRVALPYVYCAGTAYAAVAEDARATHEGFDAT